MRSSSNPMGAPRAKARARLPFDPLGLLGILALLAFWWALTFVVSPMSLPGPVAVLRRIGNDFFVAEQLAYYGLPGVGLLNGMLYTASNVLIAVVLGSVLGIILGLFTARIQMLQAVLNPVVNTVGTIPILVMAPFFLIWFGTGRWSSVLLVTIYVFVILYVYAQRAAENLEPVYEQNALTLGASGTDIVRDVLVPGTLPQILGGIRIALAGSWGLEAIAELLGSQQGIGKMIELMSGSLDVEGIFAALLLLGCVALSIDFVVGRAVNFATRWQLSASMSKR